MQKMLFYLLFLYSSSLYALGRVEFSDNKIYAVTDIDDRIFLQLDKMDTGDYELWIYFEPINIGELRQFHKPFRFEYDIEITHGGKTIEMKKSYLLEKASIGIGHRLFIVPIDFFWSFNGVEVVIKNVRFDDVFTLYYKTIKFYLKKGLLLFE
jgi:hypothetical protein